MCSLGTILFPTLRYPLILLLLHLLLSGVRSLLFFDEYLWLVLASYLLLSTVALPRAMMRSVVNYHFVCCCVIFEAAQYVLSLLVIYTYCERIPCLSIACNLHLYACICSIHVLTHAHYMRLSTGSLSATDLKSS
jgi:hypothetical protein